MNSPSLSQEAIRQYILDKFERINLLETWGEHSFFVNHSLDICY
jgi:hypothetical protein